MFRADFITRAGSQTSAGAVEPGPPAVTGGVQRRGKFQQGPRLEGEAVVLGGQGACVKPSVFLVAE